MHLKESKHGSGTPKTQNLNHFNKYFIHFKHPQYNTKKISFNNISGIVNQSEISAVIFCV